ncbi:MAG: hypothetical protein IPN34_23025 [Planctomycetes bacterium]|nr:hypothetical protein [Planctomycetota bacterium]
MRSSCISLPIVGALALLVLGSPLAAQSRSGSDQRNLGNPRWAGVSQTTSVAATVGSTTASSAVTGTTRGHLLGASREVSSRSFTANQSGSANRARIRLLSSTVRDEALVNGVVRNMPMAYRTVFNLQYDILDIGIATIGVHASAGAGTQYTAVARHRSGSNPAAHLSGPCQSYLAGEGGIRVRFLGGVAGSASATVRLEGLNTTFSMTLPTERNAISSRGMTMPVETLAWAFEVSGRLRGPFGISLGSRTFVRVEGPRSVVDILNR